MPMASEFLNKSQSELITEAGVYSLLPVYVADDQVTKKGDPKVKVCWETDDGQSVWDDLAITDKSAFKWAQLWFAFDETDQDFPSIDDLSSACLRYLRATTSVFAKVKMEKYNGTLGPKIDSYLPPEEGKAITGEELKKNEDVPF